jgi:hypothetical protein
MVQPASRKNAFLKTALAGTGCALALASLMIGYPQASVQAPIFEKSPRFVQGAAGTWGSAAADLDGDGDLDVFLPNRETGKHEIWFNRLKEKTAREKS